MITVICLIDVTSFAHVAKQKHVQIYSATMQDIKYALIKKVCSDSATLLPEEYHDFLNVFSCDQINILFSYYSQNHIINLTSEIKSTHDLFYFMITDELKVLKK